MVHFYRSKENNKDLSKKIKKVIIAFMILILLLVLTDAVSICLYSKKDETCKTDTAIVLGAGIWDNEPSPVFQARIDHGIWLYQEGYVKTLIFTGGYGQGNDYSEAEAARKYAIEKGIPDTDIYIEEKSTITQDNVANAKEIMDEQGFETALIVSDPLHMKRAMMMVKDMQIDGFSSPTPNSEYKTLKTQIPFLFREVYYDIGYKVYCLLPGK